jgi:DNA/RNA endonuclease YhcR with UshA esterase domain
VDVQSFSDGFKFVLDDGTGEIMLLTWLDVFDYIVEREALRVGALVQVTGTINQFEGVLEIVPANGADIVILEPGNERAQQRQTGSFTSADIGKRVVIEGEVVRAKTFSAGERVYVNDGSGQVLLLLWQNVFERISDGVATRTTGSRLRAIGRVQQYKGNIEIVPALPFDVDIVFQATPAPAPQDKTVATIGELGESRIGEDVSIAGKVTDVASFSKGFKFVLDDSTGQITLLTWHNVYDELRQPEQLNIGASVHITGEITTYEGALQIEPAGADDINVSKPPGPPSPQREIGAVSDHLGGRITVAGQIVGVEVTNNAAKLFVADDSGEVLVYIWNNVMERIPDNGLLLELGANVRITGLVQEYQGTLEIVPALPHDVQVLHQVTPR